MIYQSSLWARLDNGFEHCLRSEDLMQRAWAHASTGTSPWPSHRKFCRFLLNPETRTGLVIAVHARTGTSRRMPKVWPCRIPCKLVTDSSKCGRKIGPCPTQKSWKPASLFMGGRSLILNILHWEDVWGPSKHPFSLPVRHFGLCISPSYAWATHRMAQPMLLWFDPYWTFVTDHILETPVSFRDIDNGYMRVQHEEVITEPGNTPALLWWLSCDNLFFFQHAQFSFGTKQGGQTEGIMMGQAAGTIFRLVLVAHEMRQWQLLHDWHSSSKISIAVSLECTLWMTCGLPFSTF